MRVSYKKTGKARKVKKTEKVKSTTSVKQNKTMTTTKKLAGKPQLPTSTLKDKVKLIISPRVREQIKYLCSRIWEVEWSGILFYSTKGEFGTKEFEATAEHILLMNKGSQAYTEFETDESLVQFLMANPDYFAMNQGLIHSHNNMSVFFSATDLSEVNENSEFHNYYLSLIVNNKGEKCAKIAFRAKVVEDVNRVITFRGNDGVTQTRTSVEQVEKEYVYLIDCDIEEETTFDVDQNFINRTDEIIALEAVKKATTTGKKSLPATTGTESSQGKLFKESPTAFKDRKPNDFAINVFLSKVISTDILTTSSFFDCLKNVQKELGPSKAKVNEFALAYYLDEVDDLLPFQYLREFEDEAFEYFDEVADAMIRKLNSWSASYWIADELIDVIKSMKQQYQ